MCRRLGVAVVVVAVPCAAALAQQGPPGEYRGYPLYHKPAAAVHGMLAQLLAESQVESHLLVDERSNQILVRAPEDVQQIVAKLIAQVDRPAERQSESKPILRAYLCDRARLEEEAGRLRALYANDQRVTLATDPTTGQILVLAPDQVHAQIEQNPALAGQDRQEPGQDGGPGQGPTLLSQDPRSAAARPGSPAGITPVPSLRLGPRTIRLKNSRVVQLETHVKELFGPRLRRTGSTALGQTEYVLTSADDKRVQLVFDRPGNCLTITGTGVLADQAERLIRALDSAPLATGRRQRVLPLRYADPVTVEEAARAYRGSASDDQPAPSRPAAADQPDLPPPTDGTDAKPAPDRSAWPGRVRIPLVSFVFKNANEEPQEAPPSDQPAADERPPLRALGPDIEIETLPDLDVIILRGRNQDVEELTRIIEELERISAENEPVVEVYPLKHVKDEALAALINQLQADLFAGRQGRISITPLVKPDALLLIGWGDAFQAAKELIQKLDQPVAPHHELRVFPLRHAPALAAQATVTQLFSGRPGLAERIVVTPDQRTNSLIVQAAPRDMAEVEMLLSRLDTQTSEAVKQLRVFELRNSLATDLALTLITAARESATGEKSVVLELLTVDPLTEQVFTSSKSGILTDISVTADAQKNTLIVVAPAESMPLVEALIQKLDESPGAVAQIKVFRIINGDASNLVQMLRSLLPEKTSAAVSPQLPGAEEETSLAPLRLSVDERTNTIIATGSAGDLKIIEALLIRLDAEEVRLRENTVYRLRNAPALDVSNAINQILRSERQLQQAAPGIESPFLQIEREVVVVPEPVSNSLIISATPRFFKDIIKLVEQLDAAPPQVMIQVVIAEVNLSETDEFGVELGLQDSLLFDRSVIDNAIPGAFQTITTSATSQVAGSVNTITQDTVINAPLSPGFNFNSGSPLGNNGSAQALSRSSKVGGQGLSNFAVGRLNDQLGFGGLVLSAGSESVSVLIRALQESRRLEILARPQITTLDNQPAFIQVGQRVPRVVSSSVTQFGQINTVDLENVGLILGVTPRISPSGMVVMEIDAEQSKVGPDEEGIPISISTTGDVVRSPRIDTRTAQTTVSASTGETIVLGGLITRNEKTIHRRVPHLADIPVLGHLFRYDMVDTLRTELLIILTPHVIRNAEDAQRIRHIEESRMSWTLCDVQEIHGMQGICTDDNCPYCRGETQVIYPDLNPGGQVPETLPTEPTEILPQPDHRPAAPVPLDPVQPTSYDQPDQPIGQPTARRELARPAPSASAALSTRATPSELADEQPLPTTGTAITRLPPAQPSTGRDQAEPYQQVDSATGSGRASPPDPRHPGTAPRRPDSEPAAKSAPPRRAAKAPRKLLWLIPWPID